MEPTGTFHLFVFEDTEVSGFGIFALLLVILDEVLGRFLEESGGFS
jgi:hypothetical protein